MITGVLSAVVTPFTVDGELDLAAAEVVCRELLERGVDGLFLAGSTGEAWALEFDERLRLLACALSVAEGRVPVLLGVGMESTRATLELARAAREGGATGVVVLPPAYAKPDQQELLDHVAEVAVAFAGPVVIYQIPSMVPTGFALETVVALSKLPDVVGIKDSSGDLTHLVDLVRETPDGFRVLTGCDTLLLPGLLAGADGAILGSANFVPEIALRVHRSVQEGDLERASQLQAVLNPLWALRGLSSFPSVHKAGAETIGLPAGPPRPPIRPLDAPRREILARAIREARAILE